MNKKKAVDRIIELYSLFRAEVEYFNSARLFDINIYSESVLIPILNSVYGLNLKDANFDEKNISAIDLIDKENRTAIQVTSTANGEKIKHTLETYLKDSRYKDFDSIYVYILKTKQSKYSDDTFEKIVQDKFEFDSKKNIIDSSDIINEVKSWLSMNRIHEFREILEEQFSNDAQESRKYYLENKDVLDTQIIYPNLLEIILSEHVYVGQLNIDREKVIKKSWETDYKLKLNANIIKVIKSQMYQLGLTPITDWYEFEGNLISFKNVNDDSEPLSKLVEPGTVERFTVEEFYGAGENYKVAFAKLLSLSFTELLKSKGISWLHKERIYRFNAAKTRRITWKKKKTATRTVVKEHWNKERTQILAFQHLAFSINILFFDEIWYLSITPTYNITFDGKRTHLNASKYIDSQKKLDKNQAVYNHFRFITYCLRNRLSEDEEGYPYIGVKKAISLKLTFKKAI
jgi:hypothetical protein